jgi:putative sigma-54 modulation protein
MQLDMVFKGLDSGNETKTFVQSKTEKLKKYFDGKFHARWNFSKQKEICIAHLHVTGHPSMDYFGESENDNLYTAIEEAVDKLETQLRKHKEIIKGHHK